MHMSSIQGNGKKMVAPEDKLKEIGFVPKGNSAKPTYDVCKFWLVNKKQSTKGRTVQ